MARAVGVYTVLICVLAIAGSLSANGKDSSDETPIETQHTECTLISGDVRATAEASVSRKLEGFCATDHLSRAFSNLEYRLLNEINHLKAMINMVLPPPYQQHYFAQPQPHLYQPLQKTPAPTTTAAPIKSDDSTKSWKSIDENAADSTNPIQNESPSAVLYDNNTKSPQGSSEKEQWLDELATTTTTIPTTIATTTEKLLHFRPVQKKTDNQMNKTRKTVTGPRDFEIHKFNNTILSGTDLQIFTYYWNIEQLSAKLKENASVISSPIFSISGLNLRVDAFLNHLHRDFLFLQLEQVEAINAVAENSNVILKTGDLFKKIQTKVMFKHTITILNQVNPTNDLISKELENTSVGFLVPNSAILSGPYARNDGVFIKVVIRM